MSAVTDNDMCLIKVNKYGIQAAFAESSIGEISPYYEGP